MYKVVRQGWREVNLSISGGLLCTDVVERFVNKYKLVKYKFLKSLFMTISSNRAMSDTSCPGRCAV